VQNLKNHVWRPLFIVAAIVAGILLLRLVIVPSDFGIGERGYMYGWHRISNEAEWAKIPAKYQGSKTCAPCHKSNYDDLMKSPHASIACENCHGPLVNHPKEPKKLDIDTRRDLCIRCHAYMPYRESGRAKIPGINPEKHYPTEECIMCHYPHNPVKPNPKHHKAEVKP
jgi:hypothetical protein